MILLMRGGVNTLFGGSKRSLRIVDRTCSEQEQEDTMHKLKLCISHSTKLIRIVSAVEVFEYRIVLSRGYLNSITTHTFGIFGTNCAYWLPVICIVSISLRLKT